MPHSIRAIWFEKDGDRCLVHWQSTQLCDLLDTDMGLASAFTIEDDLSIDRLWQQTLADRTARWRLEYPWRTFEEALPIVRHAQDNQINITSIEYIKQYKSIPFHQPQQQRDRNNDRRSTPKKPAAGSAGKGVVGTDRHKKNPQRASVVRRGAGKVFGPKKISGAVGTSKEGDRNSPSDAKGLLLLVLVVHS